MIRVLDIPLYNRGFAAAVDMLLNEMQNPSESKARCVSASGAHGIIEAQQDRKFKSILQNFYVNLPDGVPAVWIGKLKGSKSMERCYGPDVFETLMERTANTGITHFFCGGKEGVAAELRGVCRNRFGNDQVVGVFSPPFTEMSDGEMKELARTINQTGAEIVWVGLGTPKQEIFASRLAAFVDARLIITVGAAFDFHTGRLRQAPKLLQKAGLEWLFRLIMEPKRLYKRYFKIVPMFIYLNIKEFTDFYFFKKR